MLLITCHEAGAYGGMVIARAKSHVFRSRQVFSEDHPAFAVSELESKEALTIRHLGWSPAPPPKVQDADIYFRIRKPKTVLAHHPPSLLCPLQQLHSSRPFSEIPRTMMQVDVSKGPLHLPTSELDQNPVTPRSSCPGTTHAQVLLCHTRLVVVQSIQHYRRLENCTAIGGKCTLN